MILNIVVFILVLGVLVLIHEFGHFIAAKKVRMIVDEFGVGYPPRLFSKKVGGTRYSLNLFPIGGFVKIRGEQYEKDEEARKDKRLFYNRPLSARVVTILAGVSMNLLFGWLILWIGFSVGFPSLTRDMSQIEGAQVLRQEVIVAQVKKGSPADKAGLKAGSTLISGNKVIFNRPEEVQRFNRDHAGEEVDFLVRTDKGKLQVVKVHLSDNVEIPLGVVILPDNIVKFRPLQAAWESLVEVSSVSLMTAQSIGDLISGLFVHGKISEQVSGPIGIYRATAQATDLGPTAVVLIVAILSINLALINIVPFPALDGGKLAFLLIEAVFRRRVIAIHIEQAIETVGFFLLILFILAVTYKDIIRLG